MSAPYTELKKPLEYFATLCRGCLADSGAMKNMHEWGLLDDFILFTDIRLDSSSNSSKLLCSSCEQLLAVCQKFRMQCLKADRAIKEAIKANNGKDQLSAELNAPILDFQENYISTVTLDNRVIFMIIAPDTVSKIYLPCIYCKEKYIKQKHLLQHLGKSHQINTKEFDIEVQYYCSVTTCPYSINNGEKKHFSARKNLNQHIVKVHKTHVLQCADCDKTFSTTTELDRHMKTCNLNYVCHVCDVTYKTNESLMVHLLRKHPDEHKEYKAQRKNMKRKSETGAPKTKQQKTSTVTTETGQLTTETSPLTTETTTKTHKSDLERFAEYLCDSPKRSSATQTKAESNIRNDVSLTSWQKNDEISTSTQTDIFEDFLSLKSQNSEDESSIFFSETVSLSDIQTQTFPLEFGLSRSNKQTLTCETQSPDLSIKETQTCVCLCDSPKLNFNRYSESIPSSPFSANLTSTETQTADYRSKDVLLSFNSAETQTSFDENSVMQKIL